MWLNRYINTNTIFMGLQVYNKYKVRIVFLVFN